MDEEDFSGMYNSGIYGGDTQDFNWDTQINDMYTGAPVDTSWINQGGYSEDQLNNPGLTSMPTFNTGWDPTEGVPWSSSQPNELGQFSGGQTMAPPDWYNQSTAQFAPQEQASLQTPASNDYFGKGMSGLSQLLSGVFNQKQGQTSTAKQLASIVAALMEGKQNKQMASQIPQAVQAQQQRTSPFDVASSGASSMGANSMRDAMQQKLAAAMTDPYGQPIVKSQVDQIAREQAIKDAAAGRRSNTATSSPAMMAEQAKVAQNYINSLQQPAGSNINPSSQGLEQIIQALKYGTQGTTSPLMSAIGYGTGSNQKSDAMQQILQALGKA